MKEIWRNIKEFHGIYQVSNLGRIRNIKKNKILTGYTNNKGYQMIHFHTNTQDKMYSIHRLVATYFKPNPKNLPQVNHKNEIKTDNRACNLEWCTAKHNMNYGTLPKRLSIDKLNNTYNTKKVICVETGVIYASLREAERQTGIGNASISKACKNKAVLAGGYHWKYIEEEEK